jgi:HEAT repeat protein
MRIVVGLSSMLLVALSGCGPKPAMTAHGKPIAHWVERIQDADVQTRLQAVKSLGNVGAKDAVVVPTLIIAVKDVDAEVRKAAVLALLRMGPAAKSAIPVLMEAREDSNAEVRECVEKALVKIKGG